MKPNDCNFEAARQFCSCPVEQCPRHPKNHANGCNPCIQDNLKKRKVPACFFRVVNEDVNEVRDYSIEGFVDFCLKHKEKNKK